MALATQCPHCHTTFRVAHDQLKLRAGLVRCGACKQIFNGIENLLRPEEPAQQTVQQPAPLQPSSESEATSPPTQTPVQSTVPNALPESPSDADHAEEAGNPAPSAASANSDASPSNTPQETADLDPLLRMTLMDFARDQGKKVDGNADKSSIETPHSAAEDSLGRTIDDLQSKPWRVAFEADNHEENDALDQADSREYDEPIFVKQGRRREYIGHAIQTVMLIGLPVLIILLLAQGIYTFRSQLAAQLPKTKPALTNMCRRAGCQLGLPAQIEAVSIESSELQAVSPSQNIFSLSVLLRNRGDTIQEWPSIELTLNDTNEKPIARRVFIPRDYLPAMQSLDKGFPARSEQSIKLFFELSQLKASGYRVYLFYP